VLIQQLRELADAGILSRHDYKQVPPRVDYAMAEFGHTLALALAPCAPGAKPTDSVFRK
jgi:DNA-binding HxlR family transcriptional regulator